MERGLRTERLALVLCALVVVLLGMFLPMAN